MDSLDYLRFSLFVSLLLAGIGFFVKKPPARWSIFPYLSALFFVSFYVFFALQKSSNVRYTFLVLFLPPALIFFLQRLSFFQVHLSHPMRTLFLFVVLIFPQLSLFQGPSAVVTLGYSYFLLRLFDALNVSQVGRTQSAAGALLQSTAFPTLPSGPILLQGQFSVQVRPFSLRSAFYRRGVFLLILGVVKIFVVVPMVDHYLTSGLLHPLSFSLFTFKNILVTGFYHYVKLYTEFSGYTDLVVALSAFLGLKIRHNFLYPYLAVSLRDFWRRWHRTLYGFMLRHIYLPMGGRGNRRLIHGRNVFAAFILIGVWHGLSFHFFFWGLSHGAYLLMEFYLILPLVKRFPSLRFGQYFLTQLFVLLSWVIFFYQ